MCVGVKDLGGGTVLDDVEVEGVLSMQRKGLRSKNTEFSSNCWEHNYTKHLGM